MSGSTKGQLAHNARTQFFRICVRINALRDGPMLPGGADVPSRAHMCHAFVPFFSTNMSVVTLFVPHVL